MRKAAVPVACGGIGGIGGGRADEGGSGRGCPAENAGAGARAAGVDSVVAAGALLEGRSIAPAVGWSTRACIRTCVAVSVVPNCPALPASRVHVMVHVRRWPATVRTKTAPVSHDPSRGRGSPSGHAHQTAAPTQDLFLCSAPEVAPHGDGQPLKARRVHAEPSEEDRQFLYRPPTAGSTSVIMLQQ